MVFRADVCCYSLSLLKLLARAGDLRESAGKRNTLSYVQDDRNAPCAPVKFQDVHVINCLPVFSAATIPSDCWYAAM